MPLGYPGTPRSTRSPRADHAAGPAIGTPHVRTTIEALILESTVIWAGSTALLGEEGLLSYSDLLVRAQNIAAVLRVQGMQSGDLVGVVGLRTFSSISGILGILLAGGVYVPFDVHSLSQQQLVRQLDESAIRLLVTDRTEAAGRTLPWARRVSVIDAAAIEREFMPPLREVKLPTRLPEDPAVVVFNPAGRGVLVTHNGIVRLVTSGTLMEFTAADTVLLHAGAQEHAFQLELWGALVAGGTVALAPNSLNAVGGIVPAHEYARVMRRYRVSAICARPVLLAELAEEPLAPLAQVQQAVVDADGLEPGALDGLCGQRRAMRVTGGLGTAETTSFAVTVKVSVEDAGRTAAIPGSDAWVALADGSEAAPGTGGTLAITGDALAIGYLGQPEATRAAFAEARCSSGQQVRAYRLPMPATRLADGSLVTGPAALAAAEKSVQAQRATPDEIETLLLRHPLVRECVALRSAAGDRLTCVFATLRQDDDPRAERALREHIQARLPESLRPEALVLLPQMPLDANGRLDRVRLAEQCDALLRRSTAAPRAIDTPPARQIDTVRSIWQRLLHRMQVDLDEDFYASGGTSVKMIRLHAELNQRFPGAFSMAEMRSLNTIRKIMDHLASATARERMMALEQRGA